MLIKSNIQDVLTNLVITNWGKGYYKLGQLFITNWGKCILQIGAAFLLQIRAKFITN